MKTQIEKCRKLIDCGLSLITIGENKIPNTKWKPSQSKQLNKDDFEKVWNLPDTNGVGIVTGYDNLEVIDVDLKVLSSLKLQQDFWNEYLQLLKNNIDDFDNKFVIYKTINNGYHIIYKCQTIVGNKKIAKLENNSALIETRGIGGYIFIYDKQVSINSYSQIKEISVLDRATLWECSKIYDYINKDVIPKKEKKETENNSEQEIKTWDDYNTKKSIWDLINNDFTIVKKLKDKTIIRRNGAESAHSGYVFTDSNCMYLFTTATAYPNEKLLSSFAIYTYKNHGGNFSESTKQLYKDGYGSRIIKKVESIEKSITYDVKDLEFPIDIFPQSIQNYILQCKETLNGSIDYMGSSFLWLMSVIIGNSIKIEVKTGWLEPANVWICCVGKPGIGKTPSINHIIFPLTKKNNKEIKNYIKEKEKYDNYYELDKKEREQVEEIKKPMKSQFIANDVTIEALIDLHEESKNSVGVFKDELAGWFKDMNKYRAGSDLEFWLSSWSNKGVAVNRKTSKNSFVESPIIPVLGGIQPSILTNFFTDENKDNGFIDRMLTCFPDLQVDVYCNKTIEESALTWYNDYIVNFYELVKTKVVKKDEDGEIVSHTAFFTKDSEAEWIRMHDEITSIQNSEIENEYMKSMLPKQKSYIPRFALLINCLSVYDAGGKDNMLHVTMESILKAEKLSKYFIANAKKIKTESIEKNEIKKLIVLNKDKSTKEKAIEIFRNHPEAKKNEVAETLGISRQMLHKYLKDGVQKS
jgi:DNA-binding transcriptional regulator YiaG